MTETSNVQRRTLKLLYNDLGTLINNFKIIIIKEVPIKEKMTFIYSLSIVNKKFA